MFRPRSHNLRSALHWFTPAGYDLDGTVLRQRSEPNALTLRNSGDDPLSVADRAGRSRSI